MQSQAQASSVYLGHGQVLTLDDAQGMRIGAQTGTVWVTQEGRFQDDIVSPGDAVVVSHGGRTIVQALRAAWITIDGAFKAANDASDANVDHSAPSFVEEVRLRVHLRGL